MPLPVEIKPNTATLLPLEEYDKIIVSFSGGKDSLACVLHLLELGVQPDQIELFHQAVDGRPGVAERFFDWPATEAYCNAVAEILGIPIRYQWREGGFLGEMLKGEVDAEGPFALHSSVITAYFRIDEDGTVWVTRNYANATLFEATDEAEVWQASLPEEGTPIEQYFTAVELKKLKEVHKKRRKEAKTTKDKEKVDAWFDRKIGPLVMPPLYRVQVTTPRPTAPIGFELYPGVLATGDIGEAGGTGSPGVRLQFPDPVVNLRIRWCSSALKIDVADMAIRNDPTFDAGTFLFVTGERRQESNNRSRYAEVEKHNTSTRARHVDHWRAVIDWEEQQVWDIIARWRIRPHPAYYLSWGRLSCLSCIFGDANQWAGVRQVAPDLFNKILHYERRFGKTIQRGGDIAHLASQGVSAVPDDPEIIALAAGEELGIEYVQLTEGEEWILPAGAFKRTGGPL